MDGHGERGRQFQLNLLIFPSFLKGGQGQWGKDVVSGVDSNTHIQKKKKKEKKRKQKHKIKPHSYSHRLLSQGGTLNTKPFIFLLV